jgi:S-methylmethionine-dependent homocysteine/selenocysteine methylase
MVAWVLRSFSLLLWFITKFSMCINVCCCIIDSKVRQEPIGYMLNCIRPLNLKLALENDVSINSLELDRFVKIQANASSLSPEELNNCAIVQQENFDKMIDKISYLTAKYNFKIIGGCCETDNIFIENLAKRLKNKNDST